MIVEHLTQLIKEHKGGMPVEILSGSGNQWASCILYAVDEIGILMAEETHLTIRRIIPWSNIRGVSWLTD